MPSFSSGREHLPTVILFQHCCANSLPNEGRARCDQCRDLFCHYIWNTYRHRRYPL